MQRIAFKMQVHRGMAEEYRRRHDAIWPELTTLLKQSGIHDYSIFLDAHSHALFGILKMEDALSLDRLREQPVMRRWWDYMKDIMETNPDHSPVSIPLEEVFYLR
jgi:L-rhamnose mutarotase